MALIAFYTRVDNKLINVNINGAAASYKLTRDVWTVIDGVVDISQIINYKKVANDASLQIFASSWTDARKRSENVQNTPIGNSTLRVVYGNGKFVTKTLDGLIALSSDAKAELDNSNIIAPDTTSTNDVFDRFGSLMVAAQKAYDNDNNAEKLEAAVYAAEIEFISTILGRLAIYNESRFSNSRNIQIHAQIKFNKLDRFLRNNLKGVNFLVNKLAIVTDNS